MGKLTFIYGTMGSAKTANALMQYFELKNPAETFCSKSKTQNPDQRTSFPKDVFYRCCLRLTPNNPRFLRGKSFYYSDNFPYIRSTQFLLPSEAGALPFFQSSQALNNHLHQQNKYIFP